MLHACSNASRRSEPLTGVLLYDFSVSLASLLLVIRSVLAPRMLSLSYKILSTTRYYLRRSTMCLSVRLLLRVFLPNVGKAHGVCG